LADAVLEADIFPRRLHHLVEGALTGRLTDVAAIIFPRTSDPDYKCFLYLRELVRRGIVASLPPVWLFDLLQSSSADVAAYDCARTRALVDRLAALSGVTSAPRELRREIANTNAARAAARRLIALRSGSPKVSGAEAFPLLGAFWQVAPERYTALAGAAADEIAERAPLQGPRVLLAGAPVDTPALHSAIESHGAVVVAEISPFGSGVADDDVELTNDPVRALADKYRSDSIDARTPVKLLQRRIERALAGIDAVVVTLPPDDAVFGFDYPALRDTLTRHGIPHAVLDGDPALPPTTAAHASLAALVAGATRTRAARYG
jgi:benzoyl-CoA reductase/2-hydroxyglutaryl-CoA dehydratase subunit BcrC/BadD/HgdB